MLKGSHRLPVLPHTPSTTLGASLAMVDGTDLSRFPEVTLQLEPGDRKRSSMCPLCASSQPHRAAATVSFHATNTIHRTGPNTSGTERRNLGLMYKTVRAQKNERAIAAAAERIAAESGGGGKVMGMVTGKTEGRVGRTPSEKGRAKM